MHYRLPLELELTILEFAAPPLAIDHLHDRVAFFIKISLVHRSFTAWAQDRLHDQFLYTYCTRPDEHDRLKARFEAGFARQRSLLRLYLNLSDLPKDIYSRKAPDTDSVSALIEGRVYRAMSPISQPSNSDYAGEGARKRPCEAVAHFVRLENDWDNDRWELCTIIASYSQALDTLWLKPPFFDLNIKDLPPPRVLDIYGALNTAWGSLEFLPVSSKTVLCLRSIWLGAVTAGDSLSARRLVLDKCWEAAALVGDILLRCPHLETLVLSETKDHRILKMVQSLPASIRGAHVLQQDLKLDNPDYYRSDPPIVLPLLEAFTFTWLRPADRESHVLADADSDALVEVQQAVKSIMTAPQCTFKFLRSTMSPKDALADALATLELDL